MEISAKTGSVSAPRRDWTVLYVLDGDNDLREAATMDLVELDREGAPENVNVVAQLYRGDLKWNVRNLGRKLKNTFKPRIPPAVKSDWRGMRVFEVRGRGSDHPTTAVHSVSKETASPSDPKALREFLSWGVKNYPARHYAVVLSGHGSSEGLLSDTSGRKMSFSEISGALKGAAEDTGESIDVVLFDTCSTASTRTAEAMRGSADYLVASPHRIKGGGWSEKETLEFLRAQPEATPLDLARSFLSPRHRAVTDPALYDLTP